MKNEIDRVFKVAPKTELKSEIRIARRDGGET